MAYPGGTASKPAKCAKRQGTAYNLVLKPSAASRAAAVNLEAPAHNLQFELELLGALLSTLRLL